MFRIWYTLVIRDIAKKFPVCICVHYNGLTTRLKCMTFCMVFRNVPSMCTCGLIFFLKFYNIYILLITHFLSYFSFVVFWGVFATFFAVATEPNLERPQFLWNMMEWWNVYDSYAGSMSLKWIQVFFKQFLNSNQTACFTIFTNWVRKDYW